MMLQRFRIPTITEEDKINISLANWAWDSHNWVEYSPGYCKCKWCERIHTSEMGIGIDFPLCEKNPILKGVEMETRKEVVTTREINSTRNGRGDNTIRRRQLRKSRYYLARET